MKKVVKKVVRFMVVSLVVFFSIGAECPPDELPQDDNGQTIAPAPVGPGSLQSDREHPEWQRQYQQNVDNWQREGVGRNDRWSEETKESSDRFADDSRRSAERFRNEAIAPRDWQSPSSSSVLDDAAELLKGIGELFGTPDIPPPPSPVR